MTPRSLLDRLRPFARTSNHTLNGVLILVQEWVFSFWYDFSDDPNIISQVQDLVNEPDSESGDVDAYVETRATLRKDILATSLIL